MTEEYAPQLLANVWLIIHNNDEKNYIIKRHCLHNKPSVKKWMRGENYLAGKNARDEGFTAQESWAQNGLTLACFLIYC